MPSSLHLLHAFAYALSMNLLDVSVAFTNLKRWAGMTSPERYNGEGLKNWVQDPESLNKLSEFLAEALQAKNDKLSQRTNRTVPTFDHYSDEDASDHKGKKRKAKKDDEDKEKRTDKGGSKSKKSKKKISLLKMLRQLTLLVHS